MPYPIDADISHVVATTEEFRDRLVWAPVRIVYDPPDKAEDPTVRRIADELVALADDAKFEILIENAYFVPEERMVERARALVERGVTIRVLTNSLASNDVVAVHSGYKKYRDDLLRVGVQLYELRPDATMKKNWSLLSTRSHAGLHAKAMVIDRRYVIVGSYNLDPRSAEINTEAVLLVDSEEFGARVGAILDDGVRPENSYRVTLEDGDLRWTLETPGGETIVFDREPETSWWQRFSTGMIGILPIQSQL